MNVDIPYNGDNDFHNVVNTVFLFSISFTEFIKKIDFNNIILNFNTINLSPSSTAGWCLKKIVWKQTKRSKNQFFKPQRFSKNYH